MINTRKVLIVKATTILSNDDLKEINAYINDSIENGVLVIDERFTYEVVEIDGY